MRHSPSLMSYTLVALSPSLKMTWFGWYSFSLKLLAILRLALKVIQYISGITLERNSILSNSD